MALAIDGSALLKVRKTGVERYVERVLTELAAPEFFAESAVELWTPAPLQAEQGAPQWRNRVLALPYVGQGWTHLRVSRELWRHPPRAYWAPGHEVPLLTGKASIVSTVHDVVFRTVPEAYSPLLRARQEWAVRHAVRTAEQLLAVSEATKADLVHFYGAKPERITVTPLAADIIVPPSAEVLEDVRHTYALESRRIVLFVSRVEKKKGADRLLQAFYALKENPAFADVVLVLAGGVSADMQEEMATAAGHATWHDVRTLGYVEDGVRAALYALATVFVFPTRGEGFGIPVVEAMACGTPVIATDLPVMREVGGEAARYVPGKSTEAWVHTLQEVLTKDELRGEMTAQGKQRAHQFSWRATAEKTASVLRMYV